MTHFNCIHSYMCTKLMGVLKWCLYPTLTIFHSRLLMPILQTNAHAYTSSIIKHRHTHIKLQLCSADIGDIECEESLSSANVQHVILFTEEQRGVIEDSIGWKSLGRPLVCIYEQIWKKERGKGRMSAKPSQKDLLLEIW